MQIVDMNHASSERVVKVLKTEPVGEVYINEDGKKCRRVKKTVIKRKKKQPPITKTSGHHTGYEETVYIREDGKRVRRIRRTVRRKKIKPPTVIEDHHDDRHDENQMECDRDHDKMIESLHQRSNSVTKMCESLDTVHLTNLAGTTKSCEPIVVVVAPQTSYVEENNSVPESSLSTPLPLPSSSISSSTMDALTYHTTCSKPLMEPLETVEYYINEKGQKVRRTRRKKLKAPSSSSSICGSSVVSMNDDDDKSEIYINDKGQKVRRVRKTRISLRHLNTTPSITE